MGMIFAKIWSTFYGVEEVKIIIVGLNNAGKTTTLYKLLLNEVVVTAPTIGSNVEELVYKNIRFVMWDIGGQDSARSSWDTYYVHTKAIIMVIDSTDRERMQLNKQELVKMLANDSLKGACLLVYANKQDLKGAMSAAEITEALNLHSIRDNIWHIQACCALTGEGLESGLEWISQNVKRNKQ